MEKTVLQDKGICLPRGFTASGALVKIKESRTIPDLCLIYSRTPCVASAVWTKNLVKAECVKFNINQLKSAESKEGIRAIIVNSGNANAATGEAGYSAAKKEAEEVGKVLGVESGKVLVCSTGVIGEPFPISKIIKEIPKLKTLLSKEGHIEARQAIMTTDTRYKEISMKFMLGGKEIHIGAMCKGSGMIHINMGTMLCFLTTDIAISSNMLDLALKKVVEESFNCVSIDGDTSTNDSCIILANGEAGNDPITREGEDFDIFYKELKRVCKTLSILLAADGEGASTLLECKVEGAASLEAARVISKAVVRSNLVKAAVFGHDANSGRLLCAAGYSGVLFDVSKCSIYFDYGVEATLEAIYKRECKEDGSEGKEEAGKKDTKIEVIHNGAGVAFSEEEVLKILKSKSVRVLIKLEEGKEQASAWGCDLTYDYVKINGDYRT